MAEVTGLRIGARASCSDGFCGEVTRIVIHPATRTVTHLVIEPRHRREPGRLVPLDLVDVTDGQVRVRCTIGEFGHLELSQEVDLEEGFDYDAGMGVGSGIGTSMGSGPRMVTHDAVPLGETELLPGEHVHALDGEVGRVQGFVIDPDDHQVTHVLLQEGHLWGRKEVAIPVSAVAGIDDGIRLNISKKDVQDLPPAF
jgi:sporulation protein YlmC with PRC-barrel domain